MWLFRLLKLQLRLFCLQAKPDNLPRSNVLQAILVILLLVVKTITMVWFIAVVKNYDNQVTVNLSWQYATLVIALYILVLVATVRTVLSYYKTPERAPQVISALLSVDLILSLLFFLWVGGLSLVQLPLEPNSIGALGLILVFIVLMYWQFMVYIHIFFTSLTITVLRAGIFAFVYILMQHNITDLLMSLVITEVGK